MAVLVSHSCRAAMVAAALCLAFGACAEIDDRPAEWSYIHAAIIKPNCTTSNCHTDISKAAGISFDDRDQGYRFLAGVACDSGAAARDLVVAGEPELSKLMFMIRGEEVRVMPPDIPLAEAEIDLIERWIEGGALCD
ncbi:hypothetical protein [Haliangium sp.]|uniref:hypothetical protein n=1 Tax=Haliangium sp. TaxID=2663208 RepID=UPI003D10057D